MNIFMSYIQLILIYLYFIFNITFLLTSAETHLDFKVITWHWICHFNSNYMKWLSCIWQRRWLVTVYIPISWYWSVKYLITWYWHVQNDTHMIYYNIQVIYKGFKPWGDWVEVTIMYYGFYKSRPQIWVIVLTYFCTLDGMATNVDHMVT